MNTKRAIGRPALGHASCFCCFLQPCWQSPSTPRLNSLPCARVRPRPSRRSRRSGPSGSPSKRVRRRRHRVDQWRETGRHRSAHSTRRNHHQGSKPLPDRRSANSSAPWSNHGPKGFKAPITSACSSVFRVKPLLRVCRPLPACPIMPKQFRSISGRMGPPSLRRWWVNRCDS